MMVVPLIHLNSVKIRIGLVGENPSVASSSSSDSFKKCEDMEREV